MPTIRSLVTSFVGAGPAGTVTFGSLESGPLVGVFAAVAVLGELAELDSLDLMSALSAVFSLPTVIVLEPLEPQPAIRIATPSAAAAAPRRERRVGWRTLKLVTVGQPTGTRPGTWLR